MITEPESYKELLKQTVSSLSFERMSETQKQEALNFLWEITIKAAREDFYTYVMVMAPILIAGFKSGRHIEIICSELQGLYEAIQGNDRSKSKLQVYLPPESSKTVLCSHLYPTWLLGKHPDYRIIAVAHSAEHAAKELGANAKRIVKMPEYQEIFPKTKVAPESTSGGFWKTTKNGYYFSGGHSTQYPGKRANLLLTDDIVSEQTARSELKTINYNYSGGLESRLLEDQSGQLVINTRWYLDDIAGYLLDRDGGITPNGTKLGKNVSKRPWRVVTVPAILDEEAVQLMSKPGDPPNKFHVGGSYWPEHKSLDNLMDAKRRNSPHRWAALYLQSPIPLEGSMFKASNFKPWSRPEPPEVAHVIISLDTAFSEKETKDSAESVYQIWGVFPMTETDYKGNEAVHGNMILLGYRKGHWSFPELKEICLALYEEYKHCLDFFLIEDRASGISLIQELQDVGLPVIPYMPDKDKISRAHAASAIIHSGRVYLNQALMFSQEFLSEVMKFPASGRDTVDAMSQAILWMKNNWHIIPKDYTFYRTEEARPEFQRRPSTYWSSVSKH